MWPLVWVLVWLPSAKAVVRLPPETLARQVAPKK
jgi:hypothetical protein